MTHANAHRRQPDGMSQTCPSLLRHARAVRAGKFEYCSINIKKNINTIFQHEHFDSLSCIKVSRDGAVMLRDQLCAVIWLVCGWVSCGESEDMHTSSDLSEPAVLYDTPTDRKTHKNEKDRRARYLQSGCTICTIRPDVEHLKRRIFRFTIFVLLTGCVLPCSRAMVTPFLLSSLWRSMWCICHELQVVLIAVVVSCSL